jgi:High-affinity nickel-transport protein
MGETSASLLFGFLLGLRHAFEPDHLAAIGNVAASKANVKTSLRVGLLWGLGHSLSLLLIGGTLAVIERQLPEWCVQALELVVGLLLIALGLQSILRARVDGATGAVLPHRHGVVHHAHKMTAPHWHLGGRPWAIAPLLIGMVHGLAGSGALAALVIPTLSTGMLRVQYVVLFGLGSTFGMAAVTAFLHFPLERLRRLGLDNGKFSLAAGVFSALFGVYWSATALLDLAPW